MKFCIQIGHGMQSICKELTEYWGESTVILSPLNMPPDKVKTFSDSLRKIGGQTLFDPQIYSPRKYHKNLQKYAYFPKTDITSIELGECSEIISALAKINDEINTQAFILPSQIIMKVNETWSRIQSAISEKARLIANGRKILHTISLTSDIVMDEMQIEKIIQSVTEWNVDGVYIVCEHPERYYLVDKPLWLANLLALIAGIKRNGKEVIVGYASHQLLCLALAKCDAIASGNFLNVRWFQPEHFETTDNGEPSRRATWYYCPQVFSEYKITYLDVAKRAALLSTMAPPPNMENQYSKALFTGALPSSAYYKEGDSFKHYLHCLRIQCANATKASYEETRDALVVSLETASSIFSGLRNKKIKGQDRDFYEIIDANEAAISMFDKEYGFALSQEWNTL
jgi:hypothetical protein